MDLDPVVPDPEVPSGEVAPATDSPSSSPSVILIESTSQSPEEPGTPVEQYTPTPPPSAILPVLYAYAPPRVIPRAGVSRPPMLPSPLDIKRIYDFQSGRYPQFFRDIITLVQKQRLLLPTPPPQLLTYGCATEEEARRQDATRAAFRRLVLATCRARALEHIRSPAGLSGYFVSADLTQWTIVRGGSFMADAGLGIRLAPIMTRADLRLRELWFLARYQADIVQVVKTILLPSESDITEKAAKLGWGAPTPRFLRWHRSVLSGRPTIARPTASALCALWHAPFVAHQWLWCLQYIKEFPDVVEAPAYGSMWRDVFTPFTRDFVEHMQPRLLDFLLTRRLAITPIPQARIPRSGDPVMDVHNCIAALTPFTSYATPDNQPTFLPMFPDVVFHTAPLSPEALFASSQHCVAALVGGKAADEFSAPSLESAPAEFRHAQQVLRFADAERGLPPRERAMSPITIRFGVRPRSPDESTRGGTTSPPTSGR